MAQESLPYIIAGPIMRRLEPDHMVLWLVTCEPLQATLSLYQGDECLTEIECTEMTQSVQVGEHAYIHLINYRPESELPVNEWLGYDLHCAVDSETKNLAELLPHLLYDGESRPGFVLKTKIDQILHGSCRKPHYDSDDALLRVDEVLSESQHNVPKRPALLMMSGDQIYADDFGIQVSATSLPTDPLTMSNLPQHTPSQHAPSQQTASAQTNRLQQQRQQSDFELIQQAIRQHNGNRTAAAKSLGISRATLYNRLKKAQTE